MAQENPSHLTFYSSNAEDHDDEDYAAAIYKSCDDEPMESAHVMSAVEALQEMAEKFDVKLVWEIKEKDTGIMNRATIFECNVTAGLRIGKGKSTSKETAKHIAAEKLLLKLMDVGAEVSEWKPWPVAAPDEMNDPVHLLHQYLIAYGLVPPSYNFTYQLTKDRKKEYVHQCIVGKKMKEGRSGNKAVAKKRAAFEMLDHFIARKKENLKPCPVPPTTNYVSLDSENVKVFRSDSSKLQKAPPSVKTFEVITRKSSQPDEPELKIRHFCNTENLGTKSDYTRFMVEMQATFEHEAASPKEATDKCLQNANNFKEVIANYLK